jgi:allantoicase
MSAPWTAILPQTKLRANRRHLFTHALRPAGPVSHIRLNIFPDGGVSRLRVYGTVSKD